MGLVKCQSFFWHPWSGNVFYNPLEDTVGSGTGVQLNADTEYVFPLFLYQTGALAGDLADGFEFEISAVGTGGNLKVQLHTVNADGTPNATVGSEDLVNITGTGFYEANDLAATLTPGTLYGVRLMPETGVDVTVRIAWGSSQEYSPLGYTTNVSGSTAVIPAQQGGLNIGLRDATTYRRIAPYWMGAMDGGTTQACASNTTPHVGNMITFPVPVAIGGVGACRTAATTGDSRARLVAADGTPLAASYSVDSQAERGTVNHSGEVYWFDTEYEVAANTEIAVMIEVLTTTTKTYYARNVRAAETLDATWGSGNNFVTATSGLAFTENATRVAQVFPIITKIHDGTGTGGVKYHPGMAGGLRG